jgi:hypothetical protein
MDEDFEKELKKQVVFTLSQLKDRKLSQIESMIWLIINKARYLEKRNPGEGVRFINELNGTDNNTKEQLIKSLSVENPMDIKLTIING